MENNITMSNELRDIPASKFEFVQSNEVLHDKVLETKPVGYFKGAFKRFCKNKGAIVASCVILVLVLFALIAPICTPYSVSFTDDLYRGTLPKATIFAKTSFWDGCESVTVGEQEYIKLRAMGEETGHYAIKDQKVERTDDGLYRFRRDTYHKNGMVYINLLPDDYEKLQRYQNETGIQVIYPTVREKDRPEAQNDKGDANYYYRTKRASGGVTQIVLDANGNVIPVYRDYPAANPSDNYHSLRIEGDGFDKNGVTYQYAYAAVKTNSYEVRVNYYEYFIYNHTYVLKDGIKKPSFLFGTTNMGQDILTCLASGARFSFIFAIAVAVVNMIVGAIYGSIEGFYGGKIDLVMERVSDILSAVPSMIVITLFKYYLRGSSDILVLFFSFFLTGWIGMAGTTRMQFYRFKNQEYVLAARTLGAKDRRLMFKHIFPNAIGTLVTSCALVIPSMIYSEVNLTYLGIINLSAGSEITSVGTLIAAGQSAFTTAPFIVLFPTVFLTLLMLSFNLFGNGLRDAFNPSLRGSEG